MQTVALRLAELIAGADIPVGKDVRLEIRRPFFALA